MLPFSPQGMALCQLHRIRGYFQEYGLLQNDDAVS